MAVQSENNGSDEIEGCAVATKNDDDGEERHRRYMRETLECAITQRSKDREFHGLNREFLYNQAALIADYDKSKDIKHPRDLGNARENILRNFLKTSGYLAPKFGVSERSARVVSESGHISNEIDILLFDVLNVTTLMKRSDSYEVYLLECVHGVIQIKSRLGKNEIRDGLNNLASFKRICPTMSRALPDKRRFAILFAYELDISWGEAIREVEEFAKSNPNTCWANAIFILKEGYFLHGSENSGYTLGYHIEEIKNLRMFGIPDRDGLCLYSLIAIVDLLLSQGETSKASLEKYFSLPLIAGELSYNFMYGQYAEVAKCPRHGDFARRISADNLRRIIEFCSNAEPINWIRATDIAYGKAGDDYEAYRRQPGDVRIYNPRKLPLSDILLMDSEFDGKTIKSLAFDTIQISGMNVYLPYAYSIGENLISDCPKCLENKRKRGRRAAKKTNAKSK